MQSSKAQMPGLGYREGRLYGLHVAELSEEDDIRVLPQYVLQCLIESLGIVADLPLVHESGLRVVQVLYRVFDGYDVLGPLGVYLVYHRGQRGRFAAARRAGDEHQAAGLLGKLFYYRRQAEFLKGLYLERDGPEDPGDRTPLYEEVAPETGQALQPEREVEFVLFLELVLLHIGQDRVADLL